MEYHDIANLFPLLADDELGVLADDIAEHGLRHPITLFQGKILDGRNRYRACRKAGVVPRTDDFLGTWTQAVQFVASQNLLRRHMTPSQRAMSAARMASLLPGRPQKGDSGVSLNGAAAVFGVSRRLTVAARRVLAEGASDVINAVDGGTLPVTTGAELTRLARERQRQLLHGGAKTVRDELAALRRDSAATTSPAASVGRLLSTLRNAMAQVELTLGQLAAVPALTQPEAEALGRVTGALWMQANQAEDIFQANYRPSGSVISDS